MTELAPKILLVEDEAAHAELVRRAFEGGLDDYSVDVAGTLAQAQEFLSAQKPDLIICDYVLPDGRGTDLVKSLNGNRQFPLIMMTAHGDETLAVEAMKAGALDYVVKTEAAFAQMPRIAGRALREWDHLIERKRVEDELRLFQNLIDQSNDAMYITETQTGRILYANQRAIISTGYSLEELRAMKAADLDLRSPDEESRRHGVVDQLDDNGALLFESEHRRKDGSTYPVELSIKAIWQGDKQYSVTSARDITDRKQSETELRKWWQVFENAKWGIATSSPDGKTLDLMNRAFAEMHGFSTNELLGRPVSDVYDPEVRDQLNHQIELITNRGHHSFESRHIRRDGTSFPVLVDATAIKDEQGKVLYHAVNVLNLTEFKQLEDQLIQAQKMEAVGRLAGGVAHDFNNLLTIINGYAELILESMDDDVPMASEIEEIHNAGLRAAALTRQLLAFSRRQIAQPQVLEINAVISNLEKMLGRLIGEDIELDIRLDPGDGCICADPGHLEQVILNLAVNARDAMPGGGCLTIQTATETRSDDPDPGGAEPAGGPYVVLTVSDTGVGMDQDVKENIFEPFFTTKEKDRGTGLGLSTVFGIVKQGKGHIEVFTELGKGTTFKIYFPRADSESVGQVKSGRPSVTPSVAGSETILLVEDEALVKELSTRILKQHGYKVLVAKDGDEALVHRARHDAPIDLLLSDVVMPKMSGPELAKVMQAGDPEMKVLFMSGYTDEAIDYRGGLDPEINLLCKPFSPEDLVKSVRRVLDE